MNKKDYKAIAKIIKGKGTFLGLQYKKKDTFTFDEVDELIIKFRDNLLKDRANDLANYFEKEDNKRAVKITHKQPEAQKLFNKKQFLKGCGVDK